MKKQKLIFVIGGKGGLGKSFLLPLLAQWQEHAKRSKVRSPKENRSKSKEKNQ